MEKLLQRGKTKMTEFKNGDLVELSDEKPNHPFGLAAKKGAKAIVRMQTPEFVYVEWIKDEKSGEQKDGGYSADIFKLLEPEEKLSVYCVICEKLLKLDDNTQFHVWCDNCDKYVPYFYYKKSEKMNPDRDEEDSERI